VTTEEELNLLDQQLRRLKIEYEIFFNNPTKRPPTDVEWKVVTLIRKFSDGARLSFAQRFRYNEMAQRYAIQSDLWRKKTRIREEGYRRPADAILSVQGVRVAEEREAKHNPAYGLAHNPKVAGAETPDGSPANGQPFTVHCSGAAAECEQVESLYNALATAKKKVGRKSFRRSRFFRRLRQEEDQRDSQAARLRYGGLLDRDAGWPGEAEGEGKKLEVTLSS